MKLVKYYSERLGCFHYCYCGRWKTEKYIIPCVNLNEFRSPPPYCPYSIITNPVPNPLCKIKINVPKFVNIAGCPMIHEKKSWENMNKNRNKWKTMYDENLFYEYVTNILPPIEEKCIYIENNPIQYVNNPPARIRIETEQGKKYNEELGIFIKNLEDEEKSLYSLSSKIKTEKEMEEKKKKERKQSKEVEKRIQEKIEFDKRYLSYKNFTSENK